MADALNRAIGAVTQESQPIAFQSRKFNKTELKYVISDQEMLVH